MESEAEFEFTEEETSPAQALKKLREELKVCRVERQEFLDASQRLRADYLNLQKTEALTRQELLKFAAEPMLLELIGLADNFERAFSHQEAWAQAPLVWRQGVEQIYQQLKNVLRQQAVTEISPLGQPFDPAEQQAVGTIDTDRPEDDNIVLEVVERGYRWQGKVIRPAGVKIGHKK